MKTRAHFRFRWKFRPGFFSARWRGTREFFIIAREALTQTPMKDRNARLTITVEHKTRLQVVALLEWSIDIEAGPIHEDDPFTFVQYAEFWLSDNIPRTDSLVLERVRWESSLDRTRNFSAA